MTRIKYTTYEKMEGGGLVEYLDSIFVYNDEGNLVYVASLVSRNYLPDWFQDYISNPELYIDRIMIYELQDGAKLLLRKYKGAGKIYMETKVSDPVFGAIINYSLIEVGDIPTSAE